MQETVAAYRTTLTVASRDPQLRARILVLGPTELCPAELPHPPEPVQSDGTEGTVGMTPDELTVCAYRRVEQGGPVAVSYAAEADEAATTYDAIVHGPHQRLRCASPDPGFEWVVLRFAGRGGFGSERVFHEMVVHTGLAAHVFNSPAQAVALAPDMVEPWAVGGIPAVVYGPPAAECDDRQLHRAAGLRASPWLSRPPGRQSPQEDPQVRAVVETRPGCIRMQS